MRKIIVIGGGPAGMFAAYFAAKNGHKVTLLEQNEKLGKKLYITGKGRCNITNAGDMENLFSNVCSNKKFLYSAFYAYTNEQVVDFFESYGLHTKVERGNRVFPVSDRSSDVIAALTRALKDVKVEVKLHTKVVKLLTEQKDEIAYKQLNHLSSQSGNESKLRVSASTSYKDGDFEFQDENATDTSILTNDMMQDAWTSVKLSQSDSVLEKQVVTSKKKNKSASKKETIEPSKIKGVVLENGNTLYADAVIVATGGISYPSTGATGDGYRFAEQVHHKIVEPTPSLVPFETKEHWAMELQGLALKNVAITIKRKGKVIYEDFGEMLFTHFGVSGPMILSASAAIKPEYFKEGLELLIDLKPALEKEQLDKRILKDFEEVKNKQYKNSLQKLMPSTMIPIVIELSGIDPEKKVNEITKEERTNLVNLLKAIPLTISGLRGWNEAIITKGGVAVKQVNPSTMESKLVEGLYFCGEVLDLDAMTGGYNLQIAWSTGYLAGSNISV